MSILIWIQSVRHSHDISERFVEKINFERNTAVVKKHAKSAGKLGGNNKIFTSQLSEYVECYILRLVILSQIHDCGTVKLLLNIFSGESRGGSGGSLEPPPCPPFLNIL